MHCEILTDMVCILSSVTISFTKRYTELRSNIQISAVSAAGVHTSQEH